MLPWQLPVTRLSHRPRWGRQESATGQSELNQGGNRTLDKLIAFLNEYPERGVAIEGHTDDVASLAMNQMLSQRRAEAVQSYLLQHGILPVRLFASGMGETLPVAENDSESGRQQNRRVEVIITSSRPPLAAAVNEAR